MNKYVQQNKSFLPPFEDYCNTIKQLWDSHHLTNSGQLYKALKSEFEKFGIVNPIPVVNGHSALEIVLEAFDLKGEVITTPFTFASTTNAIVRKGLTPIFADIDPETYNISIESVKNLINKNTVAIVAVHVFGQPCDVYNLEDLARENNIKLIYDAAHSLGVTVDGKDISAFGDASIFSLHATKLMHSIEGGIISTGSQSINERINLLINFGIDGERIMLPGGNYKMNEFSAAMGIVNMKHIQDIISKRQRICKLYKVKLSGLKELSFQRSYNFDISHNYSYFPIIVNNKKRDLMFSKLNEVGVNVRKYFHPLTSDFNYFTNNINVVNAKKLSESILTLPLHYYMEDVDCSYVCNEVHRVLRNVNN